jgi:hypothetical protein
MCVYNTNKHEHRVPYYNPLLVTMQHIGQKHRLFLGIRVGFIYYWKRYSNRSIFWWLFSLQALLTAYIWQSTELLLWYLVIVLFLETFVCPSTDVAVQIRLVDGFATLTLEMASGKKKNKGQKPRKGDGKKSEEDVRWPPWFRRWSGFCFLKD